MKKDKADIKKIVLAYSGGLDTSIIIPWLKENYGGAEIVGCCVNVGQDEDWEAMKKKAAASGASKLYIIDAREEFARDYLYPMIRSGAVYEGKYLLGTSIARPLQAKHQVEVALKEGADAVAHGCTGKGNDQVRFELTYRALAPHLEIIAPWRVWNIRSREQAIEYAQAHNVPLGNISKKNIYSRDENIWHTSHEGGVPVGVNGRKLAPVELLQLLNKLGAANGIGRADIVETRTVGMKSRGVYETPAGTILMAAIKELEMLTLDADILQTKRTLSMEYAKAIYTGKWFTPHREALEAYMVASSAYTTGAVRMILYKGGLHVVGRTSPFSLYLEDLASLGESTYDHGDATGFLNLYGLSTGVQAMVRRKAGAPMAGTSTIKLEGPAASLVEMGKFHEK